MMKKIIILSVFAVTLTGCVVAPYDDYPRDGRHHSGQYDRDRDGRPDWRNQNRQGQDYDRRGDHRHSDWNRENQQ